MMQVAQLALRVELVEHAVGEVRPGHELVLHLDAGLGGEVLRQLDQRVGRVPGRPAQRQLLGLGNSLTAKTRGDNNRGRPQCTHHLDHYNLPVVAGDCLLALPITSPFGKSASR